MYRGRIVEIADREQLFSSPQYPYTRLLLDAVPVTDPLGQQARMSGTDGNGDTNDPALPDGCHFLPRCTVGAGRTGARRRIPRSALGLLGLSAAPDR